MVPIGAVATFKDKSGPYRVTRYNLYPTIEVEGENAPGHSSGQALATMDSLVAKLPPGFSAEWTEIAFEQKQAGNAALIVFAAAVLFVFLVLAAQFESLMLPLAIILIVPRSEEHTSELQSLMHISYAVFCSKKKKIRTNADH